MVSCLVGFEETASFEETRVGKNGSIGEWVVFWRTL